MLGDYNCLLAGCFGHRSDPQCFVRGSHDSFHSETYHSTKVAFWLYLARFILVCLDNSCLILVTGFLISIPVLSAIVQCCCSCASGGD